MSPELPIGARLKPGTSNVGRSCLGRGFSGIAGRMYGEKFMINLGM